MGYPCIYLGLVIYCLIYHPDMTYMVDRVPLKKKLILHIYISVDYVFFLFHIKKNVFISRLFIYGTEEKKLSIGINLFLFFHFIFSFCVCVCLMLIYLFIYLFFVFYLYHVCFNLECLVPFCCNSSLTSFPLPPPFFFFFFFLAESANISMNPCRAFVFKICFWFILQSYLQNMWQSFVF